MTQRKQVLRLLIAATALVLTPAGIGVTSQDHENGHGDEASASTTPAYPPSRSADNSPSSSASPSTEAADASSPSSSHPTSRHRSVATPRIPLSYSRHVLVSSPMWVGYEGVLVDESSVIYVDVYRQPVYVVHYHGLVPRIVLPDIREPESYAAIDCAEVAENRASDQNP